MEDESPLGEGFPRAELPAPGMLGSQVTPECHAVELECDLELHLRLVTYDGHTSIRPDGRTPKNAHVIVESDGQVIADRTASGIRYDNVSPNGDSCPPPCSGGKATL